MVAARIAASADVDPGAQLDEDTLVWHLPQIRENAFVETGCVIGRGAYIGPGTRLGSNRKVQNLALLCEPAVLEDGVFVGPDEVLANDTFPHAVDPERSLKGA